MQTALIDADLILHRASSSAQAAYEFDNGTAISADFPKAVARAQEFIADYRAAVGADRVVLCLSDPSSDYWRKDVLPSYKAHRGKTAKPVLFRNLRDWAEDQFECEWRPRLEADDVLGILLTHPTKYGRPADKVAVTVDHDALQVPGRLYRPHWKGEGILEITVEQADRAHMVQTLTGDAGDGYFGIPGIGPKKAERILGMKAGMWDLHGEPFEIRDDWDRVLWAYSHHADMSADDALVQARVARILRHGEYNQHVGVRLWTPEQE